MEHLTTNKNMIDLVDFSLIDNSFDERYEGSRFENYKKLGAKQKGAVSERILSDVLSQLGHVVESPLSSDHDRIIDGVKIEMKSSTLNKGTDKFSFLQIRPNQDVDKYMFSTFLPNDLRIFVMDKSKVLELIEENIIKPQHGGNKGNSGTFCYYPTLEKLEELATEITQ